jgi:hypothetical protein
MSLQEFPEVLARFPKLLELGQEALNSVRHFAGVTTKTNRARKRLKLANSSANAEVVSVSHAAIHLQLLALNANVRNPVLATTVGATGDVELQLIVESG